MGHVYQAAKALFPNLELNEIPAEDNIAYFHVFYDWLNQQQMYFHYVELKEGWDDGIEDNAILQDLAINTQSIEKWVNTQADALLANCQGEYNDACDDVDAKLESILYDAILDQVPSQDFCLLRVVRENPYWLLAPNEPEKVANFVQAFNESFNEDGDMLMQCYG